MKLFLKRVKLERVLFFLIRKVTRKLYQLFLMASKPDSLCSNLGIDFDLKQVSLSAKWDDNCTNLTCRAHKDK